LFESRGLEQLGQSTHLSVDDNTRHGLQKSRFGIGYLKCGSQENPSWSIDQVPCWTEPDDVLEVLSKCLHVRAWVLVEDYEIELHASLPQEVMGKQEFLDYLSLSYIVDLGQNNRKVSRYAETP
jgi:hypothetical protein